MAAQASLNDQIKNLCEKTTNQDQMIIDLKSQRSEAETQMAKMQNEKLELKA